MQLLTFEVPADHVVLYLLGVLLPLSLALFHLAALLLLPLLLLSLTHYRSRHNVFLDVFSLPYSYSKG